MKPIEIPFNYNYVEAYLTYKCPLSCSYCINKFGKFVKVKELSADKWIKGLNRLEVRDDLPLTLGGGEPTYHSSFYEIVNGVDKPMDLLTNLQFNMIEFTNKISPDKFKRTAPYASIRVSFHPEQMVIKDTIDKVLYLQDKGYDIGIWMVDHPLYRKELDAMDVICALKGIDFRTKEFLGLYDGIMHGSMFYKDAVNASVTKNVLCKPTELLIAPDGKFYRCHRDLYACEDSYHCLVDDDVELPKVHLPCRNYGHCNSCDIKGPKYNRFQQHIHCAVDILHNQQELEDYRVTEKIQSMND